MITFSTCWYKIKSKFDETTYKNWMKNILINLNNCYFVVYTDEKSKTIFDDIPYSKSNVLIVVKEQDELYNYKYREKWIENHLKNHDLNKRTSWELNMLWSEKIKFVKNTKEINPFNTEWFGWCDIGYFRNGPDEIKDWPSQAKIQSLDKNKIHYANVNRNPNYILYLSKLTKMRDNNNMLVTEIPSNNVFIAGGFFICHTSKIDLWFKTYDDMLQKYFNYKRLVKDDQIILTDLFFKNKDLFKIYNENIYTLDNWFMFKRLIK
tara:strand:+ start:5702 stop:6493 length:792 start_codon:yes stop_codon:yes gene_type:complete